MRRFLSIAILLLVGGNAWGVVYVGRASDNNMYRNTTGCPVVSTDTASTIYAAGSAALNSGELVICKPVTGNAYYSGTELVSPVATLNFARTGQTWRGATGVKGDVIIDGRASGAVSVITVNTTGNTIKDLTVQNATANKYGIDATEAATITNVDILNNPRGMFLRTNAGGTYTNVKVSGTTDTYALAISGTVNPLVFNYCIFDNNVNIDILATSTTTWNNCVFTRFSDIAVYSNFVSTNTFNNCIFYGNNLKGANTVVVQTMGKGTWAFNNTIMGEPYLTASSFIGNTGGTATITYSNNPTPQSPKMKSNKNLGKVFLFMDDTSNITDWYSLADYANRTYRYPVGFAMYVSGTEGYNAAAWEKLAGYISGGSVGNGSGITNEVASHGQSGVRLYTSAGDDAAGTVNAITAARATDNIVISVTRTVADNSATWSGTLKLDSEASSIDLASSSYDTMDEVVAYLESKGVTVGNGTGQIAHDDTTMKAKSLCLKAGTYNINSATSVPFDQTSLFVVEMKESKSYLESKIQTYIPGWTAKSFVWSGGYHGTNAETYAIDTAGYSQVRGVNNINTADYKVSSIGLYRVGSLDAPQRLGTSNDNIAIIAGALMDTLSQFGAVSGFHSHALSGFSLSNWGALFGEIGASPYIQAMTFIDAMDWVRSNDDHVTSNISYRCADNTALCIPDSQDYRLRSSSPAINAGTDVGLTSDYAGKPIRGLPDIGAYEYQGAPVIPNFDGFHGFPSISDVEIPYRHPRYSARRSH